MHTCLSLGTKGNNEGGQLGLEITSWSGTDAPVWKHVERGEQNGTRRNKESGVEDTRAIHNARTSAEMRPTDKFDGKWRNKKKAMEKLETIRRDCIRHARALPRVLRSRVFVFPDYKIPNVVTI